ncbi:sensor histidine kinase [Lacrimispora defluvii]|uniref:histidine kinase n=1 Tax=Lacrimispora defluvii TaxID=2719233 RepID=A0ABX1VWL7_9FIRM|nr:HAMP domain-containing sensor histidine kinase [Lacrimispora defluvii]NNJ31790.1 HAMP domain-containing histidine kinase [Lacrimispora defluvii]
MRNKEFVRYGLISLFIALCCIVTLWQVNITAGFISIPFFIILLVTFVMFTAKRYKKIKELSDYLAAVYSGQSAMDIRDNTEGELSILKSDIYKMTLMLSEQSELLKRDKQYLSDTLYNISHQLKTPLTSMFVMTDLLSDPNLPRDQHEVFLGNILNQLKRIEWLVTSLLKLSKIDAQAVTFKKETVAIEELLKKALAPLLITIELKSQQLMIEGNKSITVSIDKNWTIEALLNILKNCIEHTPPNGSIKIQCEESPLYTKIAIQDNGVGISKEDIPHIFERFYKGKNAGADSIGIGLAMSKSILQSQSADVSVESEVGAGTQFTIKFYKQII